MADLVDTNDSWQPSPAYNSTPAPSSWNDAPAGGGFSGSVAQLFDATYGAGQGQAQWQRQNAANNMNPSSYGNSGGGGSSSPGGGGGSGINQLWDPTAAASYTGYYGQGGPGYAPGVDPYMIWQRDSGHTIPNSAGGGQYGNAPGVGAIWTGNGWTGGSGAPGAPGGGNPNQTVYTNDGPMTLSQMQQKLGALGNPTIANQAYSIKDPNQLAQLYNQVSGRAQQEAKQQQQEQAYGQNLQNQAKTTQALAQSQLAQYLIGQLNGPLAPSLLAPINGALASLGLPGIGGGSALASQGVIPNQLTAAQWDALPDAAKQLIILAWQARGGDPKDFLAGIDAQRPQGASQTAAGSIRYAAPAR